MCGIEKQTRYGGDITRLTMSVRAISILWIEDLDKYVFIRGIWEIF